MCGIAGIIDFAGRPPERKLLELMCQQLRHRGPDEQGIVCLPQGTQQSYRQATAMLGSQRLRIIDLLGGRQPIANEDKTVWTVLNGEIYNFRELRHALEQAGHRFTSRTDTEVIVHLYEEHGEDFVSRLDGMFAVALWDGRNQRLILARDRVGKKPLLYAACGDRVIFSSEFQALLLDPTVPRDIDLEALDYYLTYSAIPAPLSIFRAIRKVPPAHFLVWDRNGMALQRYWSLRYQPKLKLSQAEAAARMWELLKAAVNKRLMSDVPLGVLLSGGIDSSAVVALVAQALGHKVKTFSVGFEEAQHNELSYARQVADAYGCDHHEFVVRPCAVVDVLPQLVQHFGEPFADSSAIPTYHLAKLTRRHVTVALNGDGGDELFAGYGRHLTNWAVETWQRSPGLLRRPIGWLGRSFLDSHSPFWSGRLRRFLEASTLARADRYQRWAGIFSGDLKRTLVGHTAAGAPAQQGIIEQLFGDFEGLDAVDAMLAVDTTWYLPTDLLVKMDIATMANSLEARSPFLDYELMEFVARLPSHLKLRGLTSKYLLKRAVGKNLPSAILRRTKHGFTVPIGQWFRKELLGFLCDHLLSAQIAQAGLVRQEALEELVNQHLNGQADHAHRLWTLLMLELWHRQFMIPSRPTTPSACTKSAQ